MDIKYQGGLLGLKELANSNIGKKAIQKASDFLDDVGTIKEYVDEKTGYNKVSPERKQLMDTAMNFTPMGVAGFTAPAMTGFRRAIPFIKQGLITQEQIPIMKEIGLFNKPVEFQTDFIKNMGAEMRYVQNKAHIEGWDKARTTQAYKDMADRFTADKVSSGVNQITASQFLDLP